MKSKCLMIGLLAIIVSSLLLSGCRGVQANSSAAEMPPAATVTPAMDVALFSVAHPEQFPLVTATAFSTSPELVVTGSMNPDISRNVPVISLTSGRVVAIHARLGDVVHKGQLLLTIRSDDVSGAFQNYRKAVADEVLAHTQLDRAKDLYAHGAIALNDVQVAQDTEDKARVDVESMAEHIRLLGNDPTRPDGMVNIYAPVSGVITDQQATNSSGVQSLGTNPFTISDVSSVWVICDVYENDLPSVHVGDSADIRLNAYPDRVLKGRVNNIGATLDPTIRTAKVRIEVPNPGIMRYGMFVTATFRAQTRVTHTAVPAAAILHIHDRDWVYAPAPGNRFRRQEVVSGDPASGNLQEIRSGLQPGQQVVADALILDHAIATNQ